MLRSNKKVLRFGCPKGFSLDSKRERTCLVKGSNSQPLTPNFLFKQNKGLVLILFVPKRKNKLLRKPRIAFGLRKSDPRMVIHSPGVESRLLLPSSEINGLQWHILSLLYIVCNTYEVHSLQHSTSEFYELTSVRQ